MGKTIYSMKAIRFVENVDIGLFKAIVNDLMPIHATTKKNAKGLQKQILERKVAAYEG